MTYETQNNIDMKLKKSKIINHRKYEIVKVWIWL